MKLLERVGGSTNPNLTLNRMLKALHRSLSQLIKILPYGIPSLWESSRDTQVSAANTIHLINQLGIAPQVLFDAGARNSEWAQWLGEAYPFMDIVSFEPNPNAYPIGEVHRVGLSDCADVDTGYMNPDNPNQIMIHEGGPPFPIPFPVMRFDKLRLRAPTPYIIKVDCEQFTYRALNGFGHYLEKAAVVIVEMWNNHPVIGEWNNQQAQIWALMIKAGFKSARVVDSFYGFRGVPFYDIAFYENSK